LKANPVQTKV